MVTPGKMVTFDAIQTFLPILTGKLYCSPFSLALGDSGWIGVMIVTLGPISVLSPIVI